MHYLAARRASSVHQRLRQGIVLARFPRQQRAGDLTPLEQPLQQRLFHELPAALAAIVQSTTRRAKARQRAGAGCTAKLTVSVDGFQTQRVATARAMQRLGGVQLVAVGAANGGDGLPAVAAMPGSLLVGGAAVRAVVTGCHVS